MEEKAQYSEHPSRRDAAGTSLFRRGTPSRARNPLRCYRWTQNHTARAAGARGMPSGCRIGPEPPASSWCCSPGRWHTEVTGRQQPLAECPEQFMAMRKAQLSTGGMDEGTASWTYTGQLCSLGFHQLQTKQYFDWGKRLILVPFWHANEGEDNCHAT